METPENSPIGWNVFASLTKPHTSRAHTSSNSLNWLPKNPPSAHPYLMWQESRDTPRLERRLASGPFYSFAKENDGWICRMFQSVAESRIVHGKGGRKCQGLVVILYKCSPWTPELACPRYHPRGAEQGIFRLESLATLSNITLLSFF